MAFRPFRSLYKHLIRPLTPESGHILYANYPIAARRRVLDQFVPTSWSFGANHPHYEAALIRGLKQTVRSGDRIVVIGGGVGITAVVAAKLSGPTGSIICFEGSYSCTEAMRATFKLNHVEHIKIHHAIVAKDIAVYGAKNNSTPVVRPADLPECDILEMDCEGAERIILEEMHITPRVVLVETHGSYGSPSRDVEAALIRRGYAVRNLGVAAPEKTETCLKNDVLVLCGIRSNEPN